MTRARCRRCSRVYVAASPADARAELCGGCASFYAGLLVAVALVACLVVVVALFA